MMRLVITLAACCVLHAGTSFAQGVPDTLTLKRLNLEELGRIEVTTVAKVPEAVWDTPAAVHVLTHEDILRSGATSIPDALRLVPGVEVARIDTSRNWVVGIRGFGDQFSRSVLVLIDGRHAYTPLWAGVHWPIQDTLLEDIDRIDIIRGPGATIWGANAQNGVINIITRRARTTRGVYASAIGGNVATGVGEFRYGAGRDGLDYRVYAKASRRAPQHHTDGREFDTWAMGQTGFRLDWERPRDEFTFSGDAYRAELGESVRVHTFAPPASRLVDDPVDLHGFNVLAAWRRATARRGAWYLQAYVDYTSRLGTDFGERRTTLDIDALHQWRVSARHDVSWGLGARTSPARVIETYAFSRFTPSEHRMTWLSAFVQDAVTLVPDRLILTGGVKFEQSTHSGLDVQPGARLLWRASGRQTVWGGATRAVRTPSRVDEDISVSILAQLTPLTYAVIQGNPELEPETVVGVEGGYRALLHEAFFFDVAAFRNRYDNLVDLTPSGTEPRVTDGTPYTAVILPWINGNRGVTTGLEIAPEWQPAEAVRVRGTYSYVHIDLEPKPGNALQLTLPMLEGGTPRHQVTLQGLTTLRGGIQVDPSYRYVSARQAQGIPAYHTADLRVGIPLGRGLELSLVGQNLLDPHHPEWARDPGPPVEIRRSGYVRLIWRR